MKKSLNATYEIVPETVEEDKEVIMKDKNGKEQTYKLKVADVKEKIVAKTLPVSQNKTHEVVPVEEEETKEVLDTNKDTGEEKVVKKIVKTVKNKVLKKKEPPKIEVIAPAVA